MVARLREHYGIPDSEVPPAREAVFQHLLKTYASEANKLNSVWLQFPFFDVERQRIWIFWRRVLHTAHHRTQLTVYLRLLDKRVPSTYGPTADVKWQGADPTTSVEAAGRK